MVNPTEISGKSDGNIKSIASPFFVRSIRYIGPRGLEEGHLGLQFG